MEYHNYLKSINFFYVFQKFLLIKKKLFLKCKVQKSLQNLSSPKKKKPQNFPIIKYQTCPLHSFHIMQVLHFMLAGTMHGEESVLYISVHVTSLKKKHETERIGSLTSQFHIDTSSTPDCSTSNPISVSVPKKAAEDSPSPQESTLTEDQEWRSWFLVSIFPSPGLCTHCGSEIANGRFLSLFLFLSLPYSSCDSDFQIILKQKEALHLFANVDTHAKFYANMKNHA